MSVINPALEHPELITYFSGASNYSWLYFRNGEKKLLAKPISYLENRLPDFVRVHKTTLINPTYVESLQRPPRQKMAGTIQLTTGEKFPVSRRRWKQVDEALQQYLPVLPASGGMLKPEATGIGAVDGNQQQSAQSVLLISDDEHYVLASQRLIDAKWPQYQVQNLSESRHLPDLLAHLPEAELPALLLLDARTATLERLQTLQRLKHDGRLCRIPVILLISATDRLVTDGYKRQANSVISMREDCMPFTQVVDRICRFWLQVARLPGVQA